MIPNLILNNNNSFLENAPIKMAVTPSKGEEFIADLLEKAGIFFIKEKGFSDLRKNMLRFDFYLPQTNTIIEWDGIQHFEQVAFFQKTKKDFLRAKENDRKKNAYCLAKNIHLIRVPYWEYENIKTINDILHNPAFIVRSIWHNDNIIKQRGNDIGNSY